MSEIIYIIIICWSGLGMGAFWVWIENRARKKRSPDKYYKDWVMVFICGPFLWIALLLLAIYKLRIKGKRKL